MQWSDWVGSRLKDQEQVAQAVNTIWPKMCKKKVHSSNNK